MRTRFDLNDEFWVRSLTEEDEAREVIRLYYSHDINLSSFYRAMNLEVLNEQQVCQIILKVLLKYDCNAIIDLISVNYQEFPIGKADICQFSSFDDCYYRVIDLIIRSNIEGVSFEKLGFLLRTTPRKIGADTKYGENHGKTAVQLGLCSIDKFHLFWPTQFGICFNQLSPEEKAELMPKLCLYIPIVQNYFMMEKI